VCRIGCTCTSAPHRAARTEPVVPANAIFFLEIVSLYRLPLLCVYVSVCVCALRAYLSLAAHARLYRLEA